MTDKETTARKPDRGTDNHRNNDHRNNKHPARKGRIIKRIIFWTLGVLLALIILIPLALYAVLRSESGTRWALEQVPGLELTGGRGYLLGHWEADRVLWQSDGTKVDLRQVVLDWSPGCLLDQVFCLNQLHVKTADVALVPSEDEKPASDEPFSLPEMDLPVGLAIKDVRLGSLTLDNSEILQDLVLAVDVNGTDWQVQQLSARFGEDLGVAATGKLEAHDDWPLDLNLKVDLPSPEPDQPLALDLDLTGTAADLKIAGNSKGYLNAGINGEAHPFEAGVPAQLSLKSDRFNPSSQLPKTLTLNDWTLDLAGNLDDGFDLKTQAQLPGVKGPIPLRLTGVVDAEKARNIRLRLNGPSHSTKKPQQVELAGNVGWANGLSADGNLTLTDFPWYQLLPDMAPPPVTVESLNTRFEYKDERYTVNLSGSAQGPAGATKFALDANGDSEQVKLSNIDIDTGGGGVSGRADLAFAPVVSWDAALKLNTLDPSFWVPDLKASLSGDIKSRGKLAETGPELTANWDLAGNWRGSDATTAAEITANGGTYAVTTLSLDVGGNTINGSGRWSDQLKADLKLDLAHLDALWPGLAGAVDGAVDLRGTLDAPAGQVSLNGDNVSFQGNGAKQLSLKADLSDQQRIDLNMNVKDIEAAGQAVGDLDVGLQGTEADHDLNIHLKHPQATADLHFAGALGDVWSGHLEDGAISAQGQTWQLANPAAIDYTGAGRLTVDAHCWRWQESNLCAGDQVLMPKPSIDYTLDNLPVSAFKAFFPENLRWDASVNGKLAMTMTDQGPDGQVQIDAGPGKVSIRQQDTWESLDYNQLTVAAKLTPGQANVTLNLAGDQLGDLAIDLAVDPASDPRTVKGTYKLDHFKLPIVKPFVPIETIAGEINGAGKISGPLLSPQVFGEIRLEDGEIVDQAIPIPFHDLGIAITFNGANADITGDWKSGEGSDGNLDGNVDWSTPASPKVAMAITGQRLPLIYEPYARLKVSPDMKLSLEDNRLSIAGRIDIPKGAIEVQELPPSAVSVSDDEVIVNKDETASEEEKTVDKKAEGPAMNMDITVVVGKEKVTFTGFGVQGNLKGDLHIGNNMNTQGTLSMVDGSYSAYGQELTLRRARLVFVGPVSEPYLDIEAIRKIEADNVVAGIRLSGPASSPDTEIFSEPPMPQQDALSYVILGRPLSDSGDQSQVTRAALSLGLAKTNKATKALGEEVGIRDLKLEAQGSGESSSVVASGYVTDKLSIRYGVGVFEPVSTVALRYDLGRYFYVEAASGLDASLDVFYTRDF